MLSVFDIASLIMPHRDCECNIPREIHAEAAFTRYAGHGAGVADVPPAKWHRSIA